MGALSAFARSPAARAVSAAALALAVILGYWYLRSPESTLIKAGMQAPELELPSGDAGGKARLSSFRGQPVLLVMFMASCHLCQAEMPHVERVHREFRTQGLIVLGVSVDADPVARERFLRDYGISFGILQDPDGVAVRQAYGSYKMPEAYLIDATGRVDAVYPGAVDWRSHAVRDRIRKLLPEPVKKRAAAPS
jgi:peroxiredoxin